MCGIVGASNAGHQGIQLDTLLPNMAGAIVHRGPDAQGVWIDPNGAVGFAHRRLSILDLSTSANQPMSSASGRFTICFNGEIYNFQPLRQELEQLGYPFRTHGDTEVILAAVEHWGLNQAVSRFVGMFAFALWDRDSGLLHLVRDRIGKKPLYYTLQGNEWAFASELKALKQAAHLRFEISSKALSLYLRYGYIPAPDSIFTNIYKVRPGTITTLDLKGTAARHEVYWDIATIAQHNQLGSAGMDDASAVQSLDDLLNDAVKLRMIADVPVGAFLSGGIDSSTIVAIMQKYTPHQLKTYTIGFNDPDFNEATHAKDVAKFLGTDHQELYIEASSLLARIESLPDVVDEPLADISILPTLIVSELAARDVKVILSGDGGDELFCGYNHYPLLQRTMQLNAKVPAPLRKALAGVLQRNNHGVGKIARVGSLFKANSREEFCRALISPWQIPEQIVRNGTNVDDTTGAFVDASFGSDDEVNYMMLRDLYRYLPDDILHKVDRASMRTSIETRAPLLDHRVIEYAWQLPLGMKRRGETGKWVLKQVLSRYIPEHLWNRPKRGFGVPISKWLRTDLKPWAEALLHGESIDRYFYREKVIDIWNQHISGRYDRGTYLWSILLFLWWEQSFMQKQ
jgi:asparagine synthase (glutamine-hydrolysing)